MAEALALVTLLVLAIGVVALRAVLDGRLVGVPASIAVLAPVAEVARLVRARAVGARVLPAVGGTGLLAASVLRILALPVAGAPVLGAPLGVGWFLAADVVWWLAGALLVAGGLRRHLLTAAAVEAPLLLVLAVPAVAARSVRTGDVVSAQQGLPFAAEAPVALLLILVVGGVLLPWTVAPHAVGSGVGRLLVGAGLAAQPVSTAAIAAALLLGADGALPLAALTAVLTALVVVVARRFPVLPPPLVARLCTRVMLPLAAVQLAVVLALTLLTGV